MNYRIRVLLIFVNNKLWEIAEWITDAIATIILKESKEKGVAL